MLARRCGTSEPATRRGGLAGPDLVLRSIPPELRSGQERGSPARWMADPILLRRACEDAVRTLLAMPARLPSLRLLADETAKVLDGIVHALDGLALLIDTPGDPRSSRRDFRPAVADWLPALLNAARAFVMIGAVELFWVATAWPSGASSIVFVAILILLLSPRGDLAYGASIAFTFGVAGVVVGVAIVKFAVLPALDTFPAFCIGIGLYLVPVGFAMARSRQPAAVAMFTAMATNFIPLMSPTNPMSYDTAQFYNTVLAVVVGAGSAGGIPPVAAVTARTAGASPTRSHLARPAPPCDCRAAADLGGVGRSHLRPACRIAGSGRAVAARATAGSAVGRRRGHPASLHGSTPWRGRTARRSA